MPFEAFKEGETGQVRVNEETFKIGDLFSREGKLSASVEYGLGEINGRLKFMTDYMKGKNFKTDELKTAGLAIEKDLKANLPPNFKEEYAAEKTWQAAADRITGNILNNVNHYIGEVIDWIAHDGRLSPVYTGKLLTETPGSFSGVMDAVKSGSSLRGKVDRDRAGNILKAIAKSRGNNITQEEITAFQDRYAPPQTNLLDEGKRAIANRGKALDLSRER